MKQVLKAKEVKSPDEIQPIAMAGSGFLRAFVWESDDGFHFTVCRQDPESGEYVTQFGPGDVEHVARLMAIVADAFHLVIPDELGEDLGCLAHCLSTSIGVEIPSFRMSKRREEMQ